VPKQASGKDSFFRQNCLALAGLFSDFTKILYLGAFFQKGKALFSKSPIHIHFKNLFCMKTILLMFFGMALLVSCQKTATVSLQKATFKVRGNCQMCKERIEDAVGSLKGVESSLWSAQTEEVAVEFNPAKVTIADMEKVVAASGHDTENVKAPDNAYKKLPSCCLYRN
jgi:Cu(I)/Ag(I) efflux system membrane fusion protein